MGASAIFKGSQVGALVLCFASAAFPCWAQEMPTTQGETLSGHPLILAQAIRGHAALLIGSFSKDAGSGCEKWAKSAQADPALSGFTIYEAAMLERAPGFIRSMVESGLHKQTPAAAQETFVVLTRDEALWRSYFGVTTDKEPYVVLIDAAGEVRWHGHGAAANLEPLLKAALK